MMSRSRKNIGAFDVTIKVACVLPFVSGAVNMNQLSE